MIAKLMALLTPPERKRAGMLMGMVLMMACLDMLGVASILPFIAVLSNPELVEANALLHAAFTTSRHIGIHTAEQFLLALGVLVFMLLIISLAFKALTVYAQARFALMREYSLGKRLIEGYLHQPYSWFLNRHSAGLGKTLLLEVGAAVGNGMVPLMDLFSQSVLTLAILVLLFVVDPLLAVSISTVLCLAYASVFWVISARLKRLGEARIKANKERFTAVSEALGAVKEVKVGGLEKAHVQRFMRPAETLAKVQATAQVMAIIPRYALEAIAFGGMMLVVLYLMATTSSFASALPIISLYALAAYRLMPALQRIYGALTQLRYAGPSVTELYEDLTEMQLSEVEHNRLLSFPLKEAIKLESVTYYYPNATLPALKGIDLTIPANSTVGFVGASGSGKTTTVDVILGLLEPDQGCLSIDGEPITAANRRLWQRAIGYVPQHIYLADDSVAANIAFGVESNDINQQAVQRAAKIASLDDFVINNLPQGYATKVGERGVRLSGGQRQRIGIARALYHNPKVLILDEATSALDGVTEQAVMAAINDLREEITIVIIAHRLTTLKDCDSIYSLDQGKLINQGSFDELMTSSDQSEATPHF